jgi:Immunoglobulin-like domain of bacterial spore germination
MKWLTIFLGIVIVIGTIALFSIPASVLETVTPTARIFIDDPATGDRVVDTVPVFGRAHSSVFVHGYVRILVLDATGNLIAESKAGADGEVFEDQIIPFSGLVAIPATANELRVEVRSFDQNKKDEAHVEVTRE